MNTGTDRQAEGEKHRREQTYWRRAGNQNQVDSERYRVRDRWRDKQTGSLEKGKRRRAESLLLGRRQEMRQAGRAADRSRKWAKGKDRRD